MTKGMYTGWRGDSPWARAEKLVAPCPNCSDVGCEDCAPGLCDACQDEPAVIVSEDQDYLCSHCARELGAFVQSLL